MRQVLRLFALGGVLAFGLSSQVQSSFPIYSISTFAGALPPDSSPEGTAATGMRLGVPRGLALDKTGNLYVADAAFRQVFVIAPNGTWHLFAGSGSNGSSNTAVQDGQRAVSAPLNHPLGVAVDPAGNVYIADGSGEGEGTGVGAGYIYRVTPDGVLHLFAGNGRSTYSGDGGPATTAGVWPSGIAADGNGNLYIAEYQHARIRKIDPSGIITTIGGNGSFGQAISGDSVATNSYVVPNAVAASSSGDVYYVQTYLMSVVRKITKDGKIHDLSVSNYGIGGGYAVAVDPAGTVYGGVDGGIYRTSPSGIGSWVVLPPSVAFATPTIPADIGSVGGLAVAANGDEIYFSDLDLHSVWKAKLSTATLTRVAGVNLINFGDGGPATKAVMQLPGAVAVDGSTIYISDWGNHNIRKVAPDGTMTTVGGTGLPGFSGDGGPGTSAQLNYPLGLAVDSEGSLYIADSGNNRVRKLSRSGIITTVAGDGSLFSGGDGHKATAAQIGPVVAVAFDKAGNLYIANFATVRKVDPGGIISTVPGAEGVQTPTPVAQVPWIGAMAVDPSGTVYTAEQHTFLVKRLRPDGTFTVVAGTGVNGFAGDGGPAAKATIGVPYSLALDGQGSLYLAEIGPLGSGVRKISPDGTINTIAGYGPLDGTAADGGPASAAALVLNGIHGLAVDSSGNVYVPETSRATVRKLTPLALQRLEVKGGDGQTALPATQVAPLVVRALATGGIPAPLVPVQFAVTGGSATIAAADAATGPDGTASCTIAMGVIPGPVTVTATALNLTPVVFHLTARPWATVNSGGVVNAAGNLPLLAPGSLASIYGTNYGVVFNNLNLNGGQPVRANEVGLYPGTTDIYSIGYNFVVPVGNDFVFTRGAYFADWVACCPPNSSNSVTLTLYSDSGGSPGSVLDSFKANIPANKYYPIVPFTSVANPSLLSGRQYWLVATMTNPSTSYSQWLTQDPPDPGLLAWTLNGGPWQISNVNRGGFQILGSPVAKANTVPLPSSLAAVSVIVGGHVAPVLYVGPTQINFQMPYDLTPGTYPLVVTAYGIASDPVDVTVAAAAPGVFVYGDNWAVVQNQDYQVNGPSTPAQVGSYVTLYGTGAGAVSPTVATGSAAPNAPLSYTAANVTASINGVPATVSFAGLTPGNVGLLQVNLQIPLLPAGTYPIQITVGGVTSNAASIAVAP